MHCSFVSSFITSISVIEIYMVLTFTQCICSGKKDDIYDSYHLHPVQWNVNKDMHARFII